MSFRQFGGINYAAKHNIVNSNYNTSNNLLVTQTVGQSNSYIQFLSDISGNINIDISGNINCNGNLYVSKDVDISGNTQMSGNLDVGGNTQMNGNLDVSGNTFIGDNLYVSKDADISGNTHVNGNLAVNGNITGSTGSFQNLIVSNQIKALGGITGSTGSFQNLIVSNQIKALGGITGSTGSFQNLIVSNQIKALGGITGSTGSFSYLSSSNNTYLATKSGASVGIGKNIASFPLDVSGNINFTGSLYQNGLPYSGFTGASQWTTNGSKIYYNTGNVGINNSNPSYFLDISGNARFTQQILTQGGITGSTGSFQDLIVSNQIKALGGITGPTGSFSYLSSTNNTYLATTNGQSVGIGKPSAFTGYALDVSGNVAISGTTTCSKTLFLNNISNNSTNLNIESSLGINFDGSGNGIFLNNSYNGNVGIGKNTASYPLDVSGNINLTGTLLQNGAPYSGNTQWSNNGSNIYYNTGNVGVNNSNPSHSLDVSGNINLTGTLLQNGAPYSGNTQWSNNGSNIYYNTGNVGVNNSNPSHSLDVSGNISVTNTNPTLYLTSNPYIDTSNNPIGSIIFNNGGSNASIQSYVNVSGANNNSDLRFYTSQDYNSYDQNVERMRIDRSGNVGIGTTSPSQILDVSGNAIITGQVTAGSFNSTSDYRLKTNVKQIDNYTIDNLKPVEYDINNRHDMGFIAHELQEYYPFLVDGEKDGEKMQSINYTSLIALLVKEIQDLKTEIKELKLNIFK